VIHLDPKISQIHPSSLKIWRRYETNHLGNYVIRSGLGFCGAYGPSYNPDAPPNFRRPESDTEHASGCVELMYCLQIFYPNLLTPELFYRAEHLLKNHDIGENHYGDRPDDGSQDKSEKDRIELKGFILAASYLPTSARTTAISDFVCFQNPLSPHHSPDVARLAQLARVVDKLEAILSGIAHEKLGVSGDMQYKEQHYTPLTDQDRHFIAEAGSDSSLVASWLTHATYDYHQYYGFPYVFDIVKAAVIDVRGTWFPWFNDFCKHNHIPENHIFHPLLSPGQIPD